MDELRQTWSSLKWAGDQSRNKRRLFRPRLPVLALCLCLARDAAFAWTSARAPMYFRIKDTFLQRAFNRLTALGRAVRFRPSKHVSLYVARLVAKAWANIVEQRNVIQSTTSLLPTSYLTYRLLRDYPTTGSHSTEVRPKSVILEERQPSRKLLVKKAAINLARTTEACLLLFDYHNKRPACPVLSLDRTP